MGTSKTGASLSITPPTRGQMSSAPFNGTFTISCSDEFGEVYTTRDIEFDAHIVNIQHILNDIPMLVDNVELIDDGRYGYRENGISFIAHFHGVDYEVPECSIQPSDENEYPLTGNDDMKQNITILRSYAESLFFPVVPMEMLNTDS